MPRFVIAAAAFRRKHYAFHDHIDDCGVAWFCDDVTKARTFDSVDEARVAFDAVLASPHPIPTEYTYSIITVEQAEAVQSIHSHAIAINSPDKKRGFFTGVGPFSDETFTRDVRRARVYPSEKGARRVLDVLTAYEARHPRGYTFEVVHLTPFPA